MKSGKTTEEDPREERRIDRESPVLSSNSNFVFTSTPFDQNTGLQYS